MKLPALRQHIDYYFKLQFMISGHPGMQCNSNGEIATFVHLDPPCCSVSSTTKNSAYTVNSEITCAATF
jgi:hypothetical protein